MGTTTQKDIQLVIRAKDEATRAVQSIGSALEQLLGKQDALGSSSQRLDGNLADTLKTMAALDKAAGTIAAGIGRAEAAFGRQNATLDENRQSLAAVQKQAEAGAAAYHNLQVAIVDATLAGRDTAKLVAALSAVRQEQQRLEVQSTKLVGSVAAQAEGVEKARLPLQELGSTANAVGAAQDAARERIERTTAAIQAQQRATEQAARGRQVQANVAQSTGLASAPAASNGATFSALQAQAEKEMLQEAERGPQIFEAKARQFTAMAREAEQAERQLASAREAADKSFYSQGPHIFEAKAKQFAAAAREAEQAERQLATAGEAANKSFYSQGPQIFEAKAREYAAQARDAATAQQDEANALARIRAALDPVAAIQERYNKLRLESNALQREGGLTADELRKHTEQLAAAEKAEIDAVGRGHANAPKVSLFGLAPYETQNLLYQVNDVVAQLGSGTSLSQTLAQQGGQIFQLFQNRVGPAIRSALTNPGVLAGIASFAVLVASLKAAADQAERLRSLRAVLAVNAEGGLYDPAKLDAIAESMAHLGISAADAAEGLKEFVGFDIKQSRLDDFSKTAANFANVTGAKYVDAVKQVGAAFSAGYDAIAKLDDATNFLTASQRDHIRALFDEGDAEKARSEAYQIFADKQQTAADLAAGPWTKAVRSLSGAWQTFVNFLADNPVIKAFAEQVGALADSVTKLLDSLNKGDIKGALGSGLLGVPGIPGSGTIGQIVGYLLPNQQAPKTVSPGATIDPSKLSPQQRDALHIAPSGSAVLNEGPDSKEAKAAGEAKAQIPLEKELLNLQKQQDVVLTNQEARRRESLAGQIAFHAEMEHSGNKEIAQQKQALAQDRERLTVQEQQKQNRERIIGLYESRVAAVEGGMGKNPFSTASGYGQFTEGTYLQYFKKAYPLDAPTKTRDQILATRQDPTVAKGVLDAFTRANADLLQKFGERITTGNLYLLHFLGAGDARKILSADADTPVNRLGLSQDVLAGNQSYLRTANGKGRYVTAGELITSLNGKFSDAGAPQSAGAQQLQKLKDDSDQLQKNLDEAIDKENTARGETVRSLTQEVGLRDTALLAAQRQAAIEKAIADDHQRAIDTNKNLKSGQTPATISADRDKTTAILAAAVFDAQHRKDTGADQRAEVDRPISDLESQRGDIQQQISLLQGQGQFGLAEQLKPQLKDITGQLDAAIDKAKEFYDSLAGKSDQELLAAGFDLTARQVDNIRIGLDNAKLSAVDFGSYLGIQFIDVAHKFADGAAGAFTQFAQAVAAGKNVFRSVQQAFLSLASSFLIQIAQMIEQQIIFNLVSGVLNSIGGAGLSSGVSSATSGITSSLSASNSAGFSNFITSGVFHRGGIVGAQGAETRAIPAAWLAGAARYHSGGIAGLAPDEVGAVLRKNEEVLTTADPRHRFNGGLAGGGDTSIHISNVLDPAEAMHRALQTPAGTKTILNFLSDNSAAVKSLIG